MLTTTNPADVLAIVESRHQNPHRVLGLRVLSVRLGEKEKSVVCIRAFLPDAAEAHVVDVEDESCTWAMERVHEAGFFEALLWDRTYPFEYRLRIRDHFGHEALRDDPYSSWAEPLTSFDRYLFNKSQHYRLYEKMGAHPSSVDGKEGVIFSVWAPNAQRVSVIGDFNHWDGRTDPMTLLADSGLWALFKPGLRPGVLYKFEIKTRAGHVYQKADPYAFRSELRPQTASVVHELGGYTWTDDEWLTRRYDQDLLSRPISIYEVHLGSWRRKGDNGDRYLTYRELADELVPYVRDMGFTHIELMPILEHPFDGSWGYQVTGYFAPTSRFGSPEDLQHLIDCCHNEGIGVLLDWVPGHFPRDAHGLSWFDGTGLYEHADPRQGEHTEWGTKVFNFERHEVKNFLISNALFWLDNYHFDGLRVDAVASMLYLDYGRNDGEWVANAYGGRENLAAVEFVKHLNSIVHQYFPGVMMVAEESTSWPAVSRPTYAGGLGFGFKWNMGWMNDVLSFSKVDPLFRKHHYRKLTFGLLYAWSENFILPFSHDEVVHEKGSLLSRMPGDRWQQFANLRALFTFQWAHPGKQLLFMGQELAQVREWDYESSLDWHLLDDELHRGVQDCVKELNRVYREEPALWEVDFEEQGFEGIDCDDWERSTISFVRWARDRKHHVVVAVNFTPVPYHGHLLGVPQERRYREIFNSDDKRYGGSGVRSSADGAQAQSRPCHGKPFSIEISLPPLAGVILRAEDG